MSKGKASKATITITPKSKAKPMAKAMQRTSTNVEKLSNLKTYQEAPWTGLKNTIVYRNSHEFLNCLS